MLEWGVAYGDGNTLTQYNADGTENKYSDIDRDRLKRFILFDKTKPKIVLNLDPSKKLIYRRRTALNAFTNHKEVVYIIGYQENIDGVARQNISFLFDSTGHIEITDGFKEGHRWFYPVIFLPEEEL